MKIFIRDKYGSANSLQSRFFFGMSHMLHMQSIFPAF